MKLPGLVAEYLSERLRRRRQSLSNAEKDQFTAWRNPTEVDVICPLPRLRGADIMLKNPRYG
jgi:hypothetical protein